MARRSCLTLLGSDRACGRPGRPVNQAAWATSQRPHSRTVRLELQARNTKYQPRSASLLFFTVLCGLGCRPVHTRWPGLSLPQRLQRKLCLWINDTSILHTASCRHAGHRISHEKRRSAAAASECDVDHRFATDGIQCGRMVNHKLSVFLFDRNYFDRFFQWNQWVSHFIS